MNNIRSAAKLTLKGFLIGTSDIVPGVSGGTMALVLGIYRDLIGAIESFSWRWLLSILTLRWKLIMTIPHFHFLIPLAFGILLALFFFTQVVILADLIISHANLVFGIFFGLVLGSTFILLRQIKNIEPRIIVAFILGLTLGAIVTNATPNTTPEDAWFLFVSGILAGSAMIMPGVSGAFVLLILGKYSLVLDAIHRFDIVTLSPFVLGVAFALIFFVKLVATMLQKYEDVSLAIISGFLVTSLWIIWPFQDRKYEIVGDKAFLIQSYPITPNIDFNLFTVTILIIAAFILVVKINRLSNLQREKNNN